MEFQLFKSDNDQQWYWRIVAANSEKLAQSEGYHNEQDAIATIRLIKSGAASAPVYDLSTGALI